MDVGDLLIYFGVPTKGNFFMQVGLKGEATNLGSPNSISSVDWMRESLMAQKQQPLTWYKVHFEKI